MRSFLPRLAFAFALCAAPLAAQEVEPGRTEAPAKRPATEVTASPLSAELGEKGIKPLLARLNALPAPTSEERFAIGGLEFLSAVEGIYQWQWTYDIGGWISILYGIGGDFGGNKQASLLPSESVTEEAGKVLAAMGRSRKALEGLAEGEEFGLAINLGDLWIDIDGDGKRHEGESAPALLGSLLGISADYDPETGELLPLKIPVIRFDNADASWLTAYGHLVSGSSEMVLAFDPTSSFEKVYGTSARIAAMSRVEQSDEVQPLLSDVDRFIDPLAILLDVLGHQPDPKHTRAARDHWKATIAENQTLWRLIPAETDNAAEWIPSDAQTAATGVIFPEGTGPAWLAVLADGEKVLDGEATIPFWRSDFGLDFGAWLENPQPVPVDGLIQGWAVASFFSDKPRISSESFDRFTQMLTETSPFLAMVILN